MASNMNSSPVRPSNEGHVDEGAINLNQLNQILRDPELPKSRLHMKNILRKYNDEKRRALTLSRIQCTANSALLTTNYENNCHQNHSNHESNTLILEESLNQMSDFEVKFSQLPQQLLFDILGETFTKYENEMNRIGGKDIQSVPQTSSVKGEILSDSEDDCLIVEDIEDNRSADNLKQKLKDLMTEYQSVEEEEVNVFNQLGTVSKELEDKLSELRDCIELCESLKQQNISTNQKHENLKERKIQLTNEIKEINETLFKSNEVDIRTDNQRTVTTKVEVIDLSDDMGVNQSNQKLSNNSNKNLNERKSNKCKPNVNNRSVFESTINSKKPRNVKTNKIIWLSTNNSDNSNEVYMKSIENNSHMTKDNQNTGLLKGDHQKGQERRNSTENNFQTENNSMNFNPISRKKSQSEPNKRILASSAASTSISTSSEPGGISTFLFDSSIAAQNRVEAMDTTPAPNVLNPPKEATKRRVESNKRFNYSHKRNITNNRQLLQTGSNESPSVPKITCMYAEDNDLYVGLDSGLIDKYVICETSLQLNVSLPKMDSTISALHFIKKFNYLYCGTSDGLMAYLNTVSNNANYERIELNSKTAITCFDSSATILFIGSKSGTVYRFGLMSNLLVNDFKCDFWVIGLKFVNDCSDRLIVCGRYEISIRSSTDGSLLQTLDKCQKDVQFICSQIIANNVIICSNLSDYTHRFQVYNNSCREIIGDFKQDFRALFVTLEENCFYILTKVKLNCFDMEKGSVLWSVRISCHPFDITSMIVHNKRIIFGTRYGEVLQIIPHSNAPLVCKSERCGLKFARICDITIHFRDSHAIPFARMHPDFSRFFYCPWNDCHLKIKNNNESVGMIVEHMKTHVI